MRISQTLILIVYGCRQKGKSDKDETPGGYALGDGLQPSLQPLLTSPRMCAMLYLTVTDRYSVGCVDSARKATTMSSLVEKREIYPREVLCPYCHQPVLMRLPVIPPGEQYPYGSCPHLLFEPDDITTRGGLVLALLAKGSRYQQSRITCWAKKLPPAKRRHLESLARDHPGLRQVERYFFKKDQQALNDLLRKLQKEVEAAYRAQSDADRRSSLSSR